MSLKDDANPVIKQKRKYSKLFWIITIGICVILSGLAFLGFSVSKQFDDAVAGIQSNLTEAASAKIMGDSIRAGTQAKGETMETVQSKAVTAAKNLGQLSVPDDLKNYQAAAIVWSAKIAGAAGEPNSWSSLKNQPDPFPLIITDDKASNLLKPIVKNIADLKKTGAAAVQNKDRVAMRQIAANLLIQNHFLNAILHSQKESAMLPLVNSVLAAGSTVPSVPDVKGVDVTCLVCNYPDAYKVHWSDQLRKQYGCDSRCNKQTPPQEKESGAKYADSLNSYSYSDSKRTVCTSNNAKGSFCAEKAVEATNEIAAAAVGFAEGTRTFSVDQWNGAVAYATGEVGTPPSWPSAEGGHLEGGMGTVKQGEPVQPQQNSNSRKVNCDEDRKLCLSTKGVRDLACALGGGEGCSALMTACEDMYKQCLAGK